MKLDIDVNSVVVTPAHVWEPMAPTYGINMIIQASNFQRFQISRCHSSIQGEEQHVPNFHKIFIDWDGKYYCFSTVY